MVTRNRWTPKLINGFWDGVAQAKLDRLSFGWVADCRLLELMRGFLPPRLSCLDFGASSGPRCRDHLVARIGDYPNFLGMKGPENDGQFDVVLLMEVIGAILEENFTQVLERDGRFR